MSPYPLAPAHADPEAPLPSGVGYQESYELHAGCARGGLVAVEIEPLTGATVERCTRCDYRQRIGRFVTPIHLAAPTLTPSGRVSVAKPRPGDGAVRECLRPECPKLAVRQYCSAACYRQHRRDEADAKAASEPAPLCGCGCGTALTRHQVVYASPTCRRRAERARASLRPSHCACGCGRALTGVQTMYASRRCQHDAAIRRGIEHRAARRRDAA